MSVSMTVARAVASSMSAESGSPRLCRANQAWVSMISRAVVRTFDDVLEEPGPEGSVVELPDDGAQLGGDVVWILGTKLLW